MSEQLDRIEAMLASREQFTLPSSCAREIRQFGVAYSRWVINAGPNPWFLDIRQGPQDGSIRLVLSRPDGCVAREFDLLPEAGG
jgi:hypothetical protein